MPGQEFPARSTQRQELVDITDQVREISRSWCLMISVYPAAFL